MRWVSDDCRWRFTVFVGFVLQQQHHGYAKLAENWGPFQFDSTGQLTSPDPTTPVALSNVKIGDYSFPSLSLDISSGLTQYADATGAVTTKKLSQDGNSAGTLMTVAVGEDGKINGTFSNGS